MNYKLLNKIGNNILVQFPPDSLIKANNAWINEYNTFSNNCKKQGYVCLLHNNKCSGTAINSHSIPKKNLKMMSKNSKVFVLKDNFTNPFKSELSDSYIKNTLTFLGLCKYHDNSLFQNLENKNMAQYNNEDVFFLSYRALAKKFSDNRELIQKYSWICNNWKSRIKKRLDKEWSLFQASRMKNLDKTVAQRKRKFLLTYFQRRVSDKQIIKAELKKCQIQERHLIKKIKSFNALINNEKISELHYVILQNDNQMAFSTVYNFPIKRRNIFLYFTSLPQKIGSLMILSCSKKDYDYIKDYSDIKKLFSGDEVLMNEFLNRFKDKIAIDMEDISLKYVDPFFLEWDIPFATIPYFKLKGQQ